MKQIIFPGNSRQPCLAQYGIFFESDNSLIQKAHVVVQSFGENSGTSLINTDSGRNVVLNHILDYELGGVRVEFVTFSLIYIAESSVHGFKFPIHFDLDDYINRGNPHNVDAEPPSDLKSTVLSLIGKGNKKITVWSYNVVCGCTKFFLDFNDREHIPSSEIDRLLAAIKYER